MTYLPLPKFLILKQSEVHGIGLFSNKKISNNTELGMSHMIINGSIFRTPLGGFYNHSVKPNCIKYEKKNTYQRIDYLYLKTICDIEEGEELTVKYTLYNIE
jgi:SET domain-containing protein